MNDQVDGLKRDDSSSSVSHDDGDDETGQDRGEDDVSVSSSRGARVHEGANTCPPYPPQVLRPCLAAFSLLTLLRWCSRVYLSHIVPDVNDDDRGNHSDDGTNSDDDDRPRRGGSRSGGRRRGNRGERRRRRRSPQSQSSSVFIARDYSRGVMTQFSTSYPEALGELGISNAQVRSRRQVCRSGACSVATTECPSPHRTDSY